MGPFPLAPGRLKYVIVAIDYMTNGTQFLRFGIPTTLISDNGTQFTSAYFTEFLQDFNIQHCRSAVAYPQTNG